MKKQLLSLTAILGLSFGSYAQTSIPNGDFENWDNVGQSTEEPTNWNSNKTGGGFATFGPQTCFREASGAYSGSYCVRLTSASIAGNIVPATGTTGKIEAPTAVAAEGYIHTIAGDPNFSSPFTGRPDSLVFWYKYLPHGNDNPKVEARVHVGNCYAPETPVNGNHPDSSVNSIGKATWMGPAASQSSWQRVSVPFVYGDTRTPQYILITMSSSGGQAGADSSTLWVDAMQAIYVTNAVENDIKSEPIKIWWNSDKLMTDLNNETLTDATIQIMNMQGQLVLDAPLKSNMLNATEANLPMGTYLYQIASAQRNVIGKIMKQ
jgi:Putative carbohydrate metabolism domain